MTGGYAARQGNQEPVSIESMAREQEQQGKQLRELEAKDGEMWRKVVGYIATAIIGIVIGFVFKQIGM